MKKILLIILLNSLFANSQVKASAIKIYLEDALTNKLIIDAKVTLEGYEKKPITGKFDKKGKFYYFNKIPKDYNTIMSYHKKYNEKGFQNINGLPNELKFKLYKSYRIKIPNDTINYYKEDNSKLIIVMNDTLYNSKIQCNTETNNYLCFAKDYFKTHYPELEVYDGLNNLLSLTDFSFYVMKKNKKTFKRFNDPLIMKLEEDKNIVMVLGFLLETKISQQNYGIKKEYFNEDGSHNYIPKHIKYVNYESDSITEKKYLKKHEINDDDKRSKKVKSPKKKYSNMLLSYQDKQIRGLLKNNTYTLNNKELDSLYKIDIKKVKKGQLYDFKPFQSTDTIIDYKKYKTNDISTNIETMPYITISSVLSLSSFIVDFKEESFKVNVYYNYNIENQYKTNKSLIKQIDKNGIKLYKLSTNNGSPFGTMDMITYYNYYQKGEKLFQNIQKLIHF